MACRSGFELVGGLEARKRAAFRQFRIVYVRHLCCTYPSYLCAHTTFIYWSMSLIASSFTREWAREAYVNNVYSIF